MSLETLNSTLRGRSQEIEFAINVDTTPVTAVSTIVCVGVDTAGFEADVPVALAQVGSTNVWAGVFVPAWLTTPETAKKQKWVVRVTGTVGAREFAGAGHVTVNNYR